MPSSVFSRQLTIWLIHFWLPVVVWAGVIFIASTDIGSSEHTSRIFRPILLWIDPAISPHEIERANHLLRKGAHVSEYTIFAILFWRPLTHPREGEPRGWSWKIAFLVVALLALYAVGDEFHQSFVASRTATVRDVVIDTCGASLGIALMGFRHLFRLWHRALFGS